MSIKIKAMVLYVECPGCREHLEGFVGDPRGAGTDGDEPVTCDECGYEFSIPSDTEIDLS